MECSIRPLDKVLLDVGTNVFVSDEGDLEFPSGGVLLNDNLQHINLYGESRSAKLIDEDSVNGVFIVSAGGFKFEVPIELVEDVI